MKRADREALAEQPSVQKVMDSVAARKGWPRQAVEELAGFDGGVLEALCSILVAEFDKTMKMLVATTDDHRFLQGKAQAYSSLTEALRTEWSAIHRSEV